MRPAIEVWRDAQDAWFGLAWEQPDINRAMRVIEADRAELVAEIVAELREMADWNVKSDDGLSGLDKMAEGQLEAADHIEAKFGGRDAS